MATRHGVRRRAAKKPVIAVKVFLSPELHTKFRVYVASRDTTMQEFLEKQVRKAVKE